MDETETKLQREVQELRSEVRRLKRMIEGGFVAVVVAVMLIFPQLLVSAVCVGVLILFAFLVSPVRRMIFSSIFHKRNNHEYDA
jgi:predicted membrane channel-forming protein YqfA (hemolysin III family)